MEIKSFIKKYLFNFFYIFRRKIKINVSKEIGAIYKRKLGEIPPLEQVSMAYQILLQRPTLKSNFTFSVLSSAQNVINCAQPALRTTISKLHFKFRILYRSFLLKKVHFTFMNILVIRRTQKFVKRAPRIFTGVDLGCVTLYTGVPKVIKCLLHGAQLMSLVINDSPGEKEI